MRGGAGGDLIIPNRGKFVEDLEEHKAVRAYRWIPPAQRDGASDSRDAVDCHGCRLLMQSSGGLHGLGQTPQPTHTALVLLSTPSTETVVVRSTLGLEV